MRVHRVAATTKFDALQQVNCDAQEGFLLCWVAAERRFVVGEFDWTDPLDAALGMELMRFRAGIDRYDA